MPDNGGSEVPDGWFGPTDRIEISGSIDERGARKLFEWFGDRVSVQNEQELEAKRQPKSLVVGFPDVVRNAIALGLINAEALQDALDDAIGD